MGRRKGMRKGMWGLCLLLLLLRAASAKNIWKRALHARLAEKSRAEEAGGSRQPRADRCPPPPRSLPPGACQAARCQADSECPRHRRCCYNGCAYACLEAVPPPPVLDWLVQPKPRWLGGNGWLLDGPEETLQAEACSTTEDGAEPLLCPSGYECHILSPGDMAEGIPNRGQCVKQRRQAGECGCPALLQRPSPRTPTGDCPRETIGSSRPAPPFGFFTPCLHETWALEQADWLQTPILPSPTGLTLGHLFQISEPQWSYL
uniref:WAP four-disulfide core domain protein 1 n=1 Tax=Equus caballus TaxID=9796 RepID=A0A9L0REN7_HORSE